MSRNRYTGAARVLAPLSFLACLAFAAPRLAAQSEPACNALCAGIKTMLVERRTAFDSQKGAGRVSVEDPMTWAARTVLPGAVNCRIVTGIGLEYMCLFRGEGTRFEDVLASADAAAPAAWVQRTVIGKTQKTVFFGASPEVSALDVTVGNDGKDTILTINERDVPGATSACPQFCTALKVALTESAIDFKGIRGPQIIKDSTESKLALPGSLGGCQINTRIAPAEFFCLFPYRVTDAVITEMKRALPDWQVTEDRREGGFVKWLGKPTASPEWVVEVSAPNDQGPIAVNIKSVSGRTGSGGR